MNCRAGRSSTVQRLCSARAHYTVYVPIVYLTCEEKMNLCCVCNNDRTITSCWLCYKWPVTLRKSKRFTSECSDYICRNTSRNLINSTSTVLTKRRSQCLSKEIDKDFKSYSYSFGYNIHDFSIMYSSCWTSYSKYETASSEIQNTSIKITK